MIINNLKETPNVLRTLANWHHRQWGYLYPKETVENRIQRMGAYLNEDFIPSTFVAFNDLKPGTKKVMGSAAIVESDMETHIQFTPWLASLFVSPEFRNRGIATKLIDHVINNAKNNQINKLYLFTPDKELFYKKRGWKTIEKLEYHNEMVTIMTITFP